MGCVSSQVADNIAAFIERFVIDEETRNLTFTPFFNEFSPGLGIKSSVSSLDC